MSLYTCSIACHAQKDTIRAFGYNINYLSYPAINYSLWGFSMSREGIPLVPAQGGVYAAGSNWMINPVKTDFIQAVAPSVTDTSLYTIKGLKDSIRLIHQYPKKKNKIATTLTNLKNGFYNLVAFGDDSLYIWGISYDELWHIYLYTGSSLSNIISSKNKIISVVPIDNNTLLYASQNEIIMLSGKTKPVNIMESKYDMDGMTIGEDGKIFFSLSDGIYCFNEQKKAYLIANGIHGSLQYHNKNIYILWQENNTIVELSKKQP